MINVSATGVNATYVYNADGKRVKQTLGSTVTNYLWDEASSYGDVVYEYNNSGIVLANYVLGGTGLISQTRGSTTNYFLQDGQGSTRGLASTTGTVTDTYSYTAFGESFATTGTTVNPYRYTGQQLDTSTGLYSLRARYYNPALGRFLSQDTYPVNFGSPIELNRYAYTANNPINAMDPSGHTILEYLITTANNVKNNVATYGVGGAVVYYYLFALNTPWIINGMLIFGGTVEGYLIYRAIFLGDQDAMNALATQYLIPGGGSMLPSLLQKIQGYTRYYAALAQATDVSKLMVGKTPEELAELITRNNLSTPFNKPYPRADQGIVDQWITRRVISNGEPYIEIEIRTHEGILFFKEHGWLGRVSLNSSSLEFFPAEVRNLVAPPSQFSPYYQLYVDPLSGSPVPAGGTAGHFSLSPSVTLINGRDWFKRVFTAIFGQ